MPTASYNYATKGEVLRTAGDPDLFTITVRKKGNAGLSLRTCASN